MNEAYEAYIVRRGGGGDKWVKVWENASPSSAFGKQTISVSLDAGDGVLVLAKTDGTTKSSSSAVTIAGYGSSLHTITPGGAYYLSSTRTFYVGESGIEFSDNSTSGWNDSGSLVKTLDNLYNIPIAVYKQKGVAG